MNTFLPYPDFAKSAACLDRARLGKQRVECLQILRALTGSSGWQHHPAVRMWEGYAWHLQGYAVAICNEWKKRGYKDTVLGKILEMDELDGAAAKPPPWLGDPAFHASHRSNLLRKDFWHYIQFGWTEPANLPYVWPKL